MSQESDLELERAALKTLKVLVVWAIKHLNGRMVEGGSLRRKLASISLSLSFDLIGGVHTLLQNSQRSAALALHRGIVESYLRGFWISYVAHERLLERFSIGRYTNTSKELAQKITKSGFGDRCKILDCARILPHLDELAHGGLQHLVLRDLGNESVKMNNIQSSAYLAILCCSYLIFLVELSYIVSFEREDLARAAYEEGRMLLTFD